MAILYLIGTTTEIISAIKEVVGQWSVTKTALGNAGASKSIIFL